MLARDPRAVVLLPLGAIEQHGPHLLLSVDWLGADEIARRIAPHLSRGGYRPVLAPSIPYGVSTLGIGWSGTVSLSPPTLRRLAADIVSALDSWRSRGRGGSLGDVANRRLSSRSRACRNHQWDRPGARSR